MSRWLAETGGSRGEEYAARFTELAEAGEDVHGEAAYVDALLPRGARVLDAGCGTGRVASELARRGHVVTGVDSDASMLAVAQRDPAVTWVLGDLAGLPDESAYDAVVLAGNVIVFVEPGTEARVLERCARALVPGGLLISGWRTDRLTPDAYDGLLPDLEAVARHSTWQADPLEPASTWCVAVDRALPAADA